MWSGPHLNWIGDALTDSEINWTKKELNIELMSLSVISLSNTLNSIREYLFISSKASLICSFIKIIPFLFRCNSNSSSSNFMEIPLSDVFFHQGHHLLNF